MTPRKDKPKINLWSRWQVTQEGNAAYVKVLKCFDETNTARPLETHPRSLPILNRTLLVTNQFMTSHDLT